MKRLSQIVSSLTLASSFATAYLFVCLIFRPNEFEVLTFLAMDIAVTGFFLLSDKFLFQLLFPGSRGFYPELDGAKFRRLEPAKRALIYQSIVAFPKQRCIYLFCFAILRALPAISYVIFFCQHDMTYMQASFFGAAMTLYIASYVAGMSYFEGHRSLTNLLGDMHRRYDLGPTFALIEQKEQITYEETHIELIFLGAIFAFAACLQIGIVLFELKLSPQEQTLSVLSLNVITALFSLRLVSYSRDQIFFGLKKVFAHPGKRKNAYDFVPLNTLPSVQHYHKILNELIDQINLSEREMSSWIMNWAEKKRYSELGEIAGLVVHDLINPMHSLDHCARALKELNIPEASPYLEQIANGIEHSIDLLAHVKDRIRSPAKSKGTASLRKASEIARRAVEFHFNTASLKGIHFEIHLTDELGAVMIPQLELNQIFINLFTNSIENLLANTISSPEIEVKITFDDTKTVILSIRDNGTGMTASDYELASGKQMTTEQIRQGVGLRLTRRLVEQYAGELTVGKGPTNVGTTYFLRLNKG